MYKLYTLEKQYISRKYRKKQVHCILFKICYLLPKYAKTHHLIEKLTRVLYHKYQQP